MNPTPLRRSLVAVATTLACLVAMAGPAAATTHDVDITGGVIWLSKTGVSETINLVPTAGSCTAPSTLQLDETGTTVAVTAFSSSQIRTTLGVNNLWVLTRSSLGNVNGALDSTSVPHTITGMRMGVLITIYNTASCSPTAVVLCTLADVLGLSGTSTSTTATHTVTLSGYSVGILQAFPTCTTGLNHYVGTTSSTTSAITGTITT